MRRQHVMIAAVVLTLAATWWASGVEEGDDASPAASARRPAAAAGAITDDAPRAARQSARQPSRTANNDEARAAWLRQLQPVSRGATSPEGVAPLFGTASFQPPPPKPVVVAAPPPTAPPLRFTYLGLLDEGEGKAVFLGDGNNLLIARPGETLAGQYRVDSISTTAMVLEYLPLGQKQTLQFGKN